VQEAGQVTVGFQHVPGVVQTPVAPHVWQPPARAGGQAGGLGMGILIGIHGLGRKKNFSSFLASAKTTVAIAANKMIEMNLFILLINFCETL